MTDSQSDGEHDGLENWLQDLRTDLSNDPPDWLDPTAVQEVPPLGEDPDWLDPRPVARDATQADGGRHHVDERDPKPTYGDGHPPHQANGGGRHRADD
jgi:hypothetical protein